jgi:hypothetical protein
LRTFAQGHGRTRSHGPQQQPTRGSRLRDSAGR